MYNIAFVQAVHTLLDDRVYYHQRMSLEKAGHTVSIVSAMKTYVPVTDNKYFSFDGSKLSKLDLISKFKQCLTDIKPDVIFCDTPIAVVAAHTYRNTLPKDKYVFIVYDVTEFYPSKKNVVGLNAIFKTAKKATLKGLNLYAGDLSDAFIFGEYFKSKLLKKIFPSKKSLMLPYYPFKSYVDKAPIKRDFNNWTFSYNGNLTAEKGFERTLNAIVDIALKYRDKSFKFNVVCGFTSNNNYHYDRQIPDNLKVEYRDYMPFQEFCNFLPQNDIFFDLRDDDEENTRCLPIKLFYYMAAGRPSVFSNLMSINNEFDNFNDVGKLVNPNNHKKIINAVSILIDNPDYYNACCNNAYNLSMEIYNWDSLEKTFVDFINKL